MELGSRVSAFQTSQIFCDVTVERPKPASENDEPIKGE